MEVNGELITLAGTIFGLNAVSQGVGKLLETVSRQVDLWAEPFHVRAKAKADADAKAIKAVADERVRLLKSELKGIAGGAYKPAIELAIRRADMRIRNLASIVDKALDFVPENVSPKPVDDDWLSQFLVYSQDVGNAEMQSVWSQILAGEVAEPGSYSLRTMESVKVMSRSDAEMFTRFCRTIWTEDDGTPHPLIPRSTAATSIPEHDFPIGTFEHLDAIGLVRYSTDLEIGLVIKDQMHLSYGGVRFVVRRSPRYALQHATPVLRNVEHKEYFGIGFVILTEIGRQLARIAAPAYDDSYVTKVRNLYGCYNWDIVPVG